MTWVDQLKTDGYARFEALCPPALVAQANALIDDDLAHRFDPSRQREYDCQTYCPDLCGHPSIVALLTHSGARERIDEVMGFERTDKGHHWAQIAIRQAHNDHRQLPPEWHIDGVADGENGVEGPELQSYSMLVAVFLTQTPSTFAGNFTVWPGSHLRHAAWFRSTGPDALFAGMPDVEHGPPVQLMTRPGDVVIAHYQLAHCAAVNNSAVERRAVFFRIGHQGLPACRWEHLVDPWAGWSVD